MKATFVIFTGLILTGCALQAPTPEEIAAAPFNDAVEPQIVCKMEKPTGSNRPVQVCREVPSALDREQTRRDMGVLKRQTEATQHK